MHENGLSINKHIVCLSLLHFYIAYEITLANNKNTFGVKTFGKGRNNYLKITTGKKGYT